MKSFSTGQRCRQRQQGFSLIEVLISLVILGAGVMGASAMQLSALRAARHTSAQTSAVQMATDFGERMRINHVASKTDGAAYLSVNYRAAEGEPAGGVSCYSKRCSPAELEAADIHELKKQLRKDIPDGRVLVCRDERPWNTGVKTLTWDCSGGAEAPIVVKIGWPEKGGDGAPLSDANSFPPLVAMAVATHAP
jgi:type IV pilus assembly protein PilV